MSPPGGLRVLLGRWREVRREARSLHQALGFFSLYVLFRLWGLIINCLPVEMSLHFGRAMGRMWWYISPRHRARALEHLRPSLGHRYGEARLAEIARRSFEHFAQVFLVELVMTPRLITPWSWSRYVELGNLDAALRLLLERRGLIMITAHFGNFELLGYTISRLGLPINAVMRPLDNPLLTDLLVQTRASSGLSLLFKRGASERFEQILDEGGALCFIADQDAGRKGVFADFFGRKASWYKSIGLLAMHKRVPVVVGHAVRTREGMHYRVEVERIIQPEEWEPQPDGLAWLTGQFAAALQSAITRWPEQYLWMHRRWKTRPPEELRADAASAS